MSQIFASTIRLQLEWVSEYYGPNPYADSAVVVGKLMADRLPEIEHIEKATADLWAYAGMQPTLKNKVAESCAGDALLGLGQAATSWAMGVLNEVRGFVQNAAAVRMGECVHLSIGFHQSQISRDALNLALHSLVQLMKGELVRTKFRANLQQMWQACLRYHPDYQARILMVGARDMDLPYLPFLMGSKYWQFGWGVKARVFMESSSNQDGILGQKWQKSKVTAKAVMRTLGLPTPDHVLVLHEDEVRAAVERLGYPCVLKPLDTGSGKGVTANVRTLSGAFTAFRVAHEQNQGPVLVEAYVQGEDHRLMVIDGQFVAAIRREPSFVVGNGQKTVGELVSELNANRTSNMVRSRYLRRIAKDEVLELHLASQSITLSDVVPNGQRVTLRSNANLSTGGICTDVTADCHPQVRAMAVLLAKCSGLSTIGIDYLTTDITQPPEKTGGAFIEMNSTPGLDACVAAGWPESKIAHFVLGNSVGRIPIDISIISTAGLQQLIADADTTHLKIDEALVIGQELRLGVLCLRIETAEPWAAVRAALRNAMVRSMHLICTPPELEMFGCPVDIVRQTTIAIGNGNEVLSAEWIKVLNICSESLSVCVNENEILNRLGAKIRD